METETLFYWIALGLGIAVFIVGIISVSTLTDYGGKLEIYSLMTLILVILITVNPP